MSSIITEDDLTNYLFNNPKVKCKNVKNLINKLNIIKEQQKENLYIITDFDATLSKHHDENDIDKKRLPSSFGVLEQDENLSPETKKFAADNYTKYYPIEMDLKMDIDVKLGHMVKWWTSTQNAVASAKKVTTESLIKTVKNSDVALRNNANTFLNNLNKNNIPCLIFSAGCGQVVDIMLKHKEPICWHESNMVLISNMLIFDQETGILDSWSRPPIHSLNKSNALDRLIERGETFNAKNDYKKLVNLINNKPNLITMGDHLRDPNMKLGMPEENTKNCIDIGFLNYNIDANLELYLKEFDMLLVDDMSMDVVNYIMEYIVGDISHKQGSESIENQVEGLTIDSGIEGKESQESR